MGKGIGLKTDPIIGNSMFLRLEGAGKSIDTIQDVSGLKLETDLAETQVSLGKGRMLIDKSRGATPIKAGSLTLKYVLKGDKDPGLQWRQQVIKGEITKARQNITLVWMDYKGSVVKEWNFVNAWPAKRAFSNMSVKGNEPVTVTLTIQFEKVEVKGVNS